MGLISSLARRRRGPAPANPGHTLSGARGSWRLSLAAVPLLALVLVLRLCFPVGGVVQGAEVHVPVCVEVTGTVAPQGGSKPFLECAPGDAAP